jgi:phage regulator Rha-like protein
MKWLVVIFLILLTVFMAFSFFFLEEKLLEEKRQSQFYLNKSNDLERRLIFLERAYQNKERTLEEIKAALGDLEDKVQLETLQRYVPKDTWNQINPIINRLRELKSGG